jgi:hypothetical protein
MTRRPWDNPDEIAILVASVARGNNSQEQLNALKQAGFARTIEGVRTKRQSLATRGQLAARRLWTDPEDAILRASMRRGDSPAEQRAALLAAGYDRPLGGIEHRREMLAGDRPPLPRVAPSNVRRNRDDRLAALCVCRVWGTV